MTFPIDTACHAHLINDAVPYNCIKEHKLEGMRADLVILPEGCRLYGNRFVFAYLLKRTRSTLIKVKKQSRMLLRLLVLAIDNQGARAEFARLAYPGAVLSCQFEERKAWGYLVEGRGRRPQVLLLESDLMRSCARHRPFSQHCMLVRQFLENARKMSRSNAKALMDLVLGNDCEEDGDYDSVWEALLAEPNAVMMLGERVALKHPLSFAKEPPKDTELVQFGKRHWQRLVKLSF